MNKAELIATQMASGVNVQKIWGDIIINVKAAPFNAKGRGDDTASFQSAINYAISIGKHDIYIPAGEYTYTTLTNTSDISFYGDGVTLNGTTVLEVLSLHSLGVRIDNIVASAGESNTEIVDARLPAVGPAYPTLKDRLDTERAELMVDDNALEALIEAHKEDPTSAHNATAIIFTPGDSGISATSVDGAIKEIDTVLDALQSGDSSAAADAARVSTPYGVTYDTLKDRVDHTDAEAIALKADVVQRAVNVKTYGAGGQGLTDDTDAITAAMNYLKSVGGGGLIFPEGTYNSRLNAFEDVSNVVIMGYGAKVRTSALEESVDRRSPLTFTNCSNISIFGLEVDGQFDTWVSPPTNAVNHCLAFIDCQNILLRDCYLHDSGTQRVASDKYGDGVYATGATTDRFTVDNCRLENCARWGVAILAGSFHRITNNAYLYNKSTVTRFGFADLEYSSNPKGTEIVIIGNSVRGGANLKLSGVNGFDNVIISGNNIDGSINGVLSEFVNLAIILDNITNLKVIGNNVINIDGECLYLENCHQIIAQGNDFRGQSSRVVTTRLGTSFLQLKNNTIYTNRNSGAATGVDIDNTGTNIDVISNNITSTIGFGMVSDSQYVRVIGNYIKSAANNGFRLLTYPHHVEGNTVNDGVGAGGRLSAHAHTVLNNNMTIGTSGGNWWEGGGYYYNPDLSKGGRNIIYLSAAPTAGTWKVGDRVYNSSSTNGGIDYWVCITAGSPGTWTPVQLGVLSSISATPLGLGFRAIVAGVIYMSKGTSSSADWVAVS